MEKEISSTEKVLEKDGKSDIRNPAYIVVFLLFVLLLVPQVRETLHEIGQRWLYILLFSFSLSFCLTPLIKKIAIRYNVVDVPDTRKLHPSPTPLLGGVVIFTAFLLAVFLNSIFSKEIMVVMGSIVIIFVSGLLDDLWEVSSLFRLIGQIMAVCLLAYFGIVVVICKPEGLGLIFNFLITLVWIVGITNSMNFFDGMDGLAIGLSMLIAIFLGVVAFQSNQPFLGWLTIAVFGSCLGFFPYNFSIKRNATVFLGDSGSSVLGFTLATLAVMGEWSESSVISSLATPVLIFSILIYDMIYITINRFFTGKISSLKDWLDYVDRDHLHHRMEALLHSRKKSVVFVILLSFTLSVNALILRDASTVIAWFLLLQAVAILLVVTILEVAGNRSERRNKDIS